MKEQAGSIAAEEKLTEELLYRGVKSEGQISSTGVMFLSPDLQYAKKYGVVSDYLLSSEAKALDLTRFKGVDHYEEVWNFLEKSLGSKTAEKLMISKSTRINPDSMQMDVYTLLRGEDNVKALRDSGIDVVRYNQLSDLEDAKSVAVLNQNMIRKKTNESAPKPSENIPEQRAETEPAKKETAEAPADAAHQEGDPITSEASRFAANNPDLPIAIGKNADGSDIVMTPKQWLDETNAELAGAREDARLFEVAASCLLGAS